MYSYFSNKRVGVNKRVALDKGEGFNKRGGSRGSGVNFDLLHKSKWLQRHPELTKIYMP